MNTRTLGSGAAALEVSAQGLGCMGMAANYGPPMTQADAGPRCSINYSYQDRCHTSKRKKGRAVRLVAGPQPQRASRNGQNAPGFG